MMNKEAVEIAMMIANMRAEEQSRFFEELRNAGVFEDAEIESIQIVVGFFRLQMFPRLAKEIKNAAAIEMYNNIRREA